MKPIYYLLIALAAALIWGFLYLQNNKLDITRHSFKSDAVKDDVKLVHLSDLHSKPQRAVLKTVKNLQPDVIMITGDYINDRARRREKMLAFAKALTEIAPVYYITGNHERRLEDFDKLMQELRDSGFHVLLDEIAAFNVNGTPIAVLGLDENQASFEAYRERKAGTFQYKDVSSLFETFTKYNAYKIVLSHFPENFSMIKEMNYQQYDFDLQLSGHAHGGQFILPFIGPVLSPGQGLFPKYARGKFGDRPAMLVSRGIGNAEFPFRLFNHPEIIEITLKNNNED